MKILIVEDNDDSRYLLALTVKRLGYEVIEASTGLAAVELAGAARPDLILMDLGLPGLPGDEATARLKADPATSKIPVVIHTAFNQGLRTDRALAAGAATILQKPVAAAKLREVLERYLNSGNEAMIIAGRENVGELPKLGLDLTH